MTVVPPDFGGLVGVWHPDGTAYLVRYAHGKSVEGIRFTPLNLLQARQLIEVLLADGERKGYITDEHRRQSETFPPTTADKTPPRERVDEVLGEG
jgi:hypothetical protein